MSAPPPANAAPPPEPPESPVERISALDRRNPMSRVYPGAFLAEFAAGALRFLLPLALAERGVGLASIGLVVAVFATVSLLSRGVAASVYRYRRARRLIVVAGLFSSLGYLLLPLAGAVPAYAALVALDGFGWAILTTSLLAIVLTHTPAALPSTQAMSWHVGIQGAAIASGAFVGGISGQIFGIWPALTVLAVLPVLASVLMAVRLPRPGTVLVDEHAPRHLVATEDSETVELSTAEQGATTRDVATPSLRARGLERLKAFVAAARDLPAAVWTAAIVAAYLNVMNGLIQSFFPLLGVAAGMSVAQVGTLSSVRTAVSSVARFGAGWIFDRVEPRRAHLPLLTASAFSVVLLPLTAASFVATLPLMALSGISRGLLRVTTGAAAMDSLKGRRAGPAAAVMTAGLDVGKIVGPLLGGVLAAALGLETMFVIVPLAFLAAAVVGTLVARRQRRGSEDAAHG